MTDATYKNAEQLAKLGRLEEAQAMCEELLNANPDDYLTLYLSGAIYLLQREYERCRNRCTRLLEMRQDNADAFNMMAAVSADCDMDFAATEMWLKKSLACNPNHPRALVNLGNLALQKWDLTTARKYYKRVLELTGNNDAPAYNGLAGVESVRGELDKAIGYYEAALKCAPDDRQVISNLMGALYTGKRRDDAIELALQVAGYESHGVEALSAFSCFRAHGLWEAAEPLLPSVLAELCNRVSNYRLYMISNLNLLGVYEASNEQVFAVHCRSGEAIEKMRIKPPFEDHPEAFTASKKIRLAYLSADLRSHVVTHFFKELVNCRNRGRFELFLYSNMPESEEDEVTASYRKFSDHFISVFNMSDMELAERIRADGVQILVDMGGYTTDNRLVTLSYRPAPVQIAYLGYPYTYGIKEMDYHISDPWLDGPLNAGCFIEKPLRMPQSFITIGEMFEQEINIQPPVQRNGYITFGSLNNVYKLNPQTIALMSQVLLQTSGSRLYLNHPNYYMPRTQKSVMDAFARHGITADRITMIWEKHPSGSHLRYYNEIDIVLDAMPLTGGTTTIDALWMGVPVITRVGEAHPNRLSYSIIKNTGIDLEDCIAFSEEEYVQKAVALARQPERIAMLRRGIPESMKKGILCDPIRFTAQFEATLIEAWNRKFPDVPIESLLGEDTTDIAIGNARIVVREAASDMHTYVLKEHGRWYEQEAAFLEKNASVLGDLWDFAEDPGVFSIPVAYAQSGNYGKTVVIRQAGLSSMLLKQSIERFSLNNLLLVSNTSSANTPPDIVRFSLDCNDGSGKFIEQQAVALEKSPLVLISLRSPAGEDRSTFDLLKTKGYQAYRLLPGYGFLVALNESEKLDPSWVNIFLCQSERAEILAQHGLLSNTTADIADMPTALDMFWADELRSKPYATEWVDRWLEHPAGGQWGDMYRLVLNLDAQARDPAFPSAQRQARLQVAFSIISLLIQGEATAPRLMTGIRIATDIGLRVTAVEWARALSNGLLGVAGTLLDEPFLMPFDFWEELVIPQDEVDWIRTLALIAAERLRSFSSWYTADESLAFWEELMQHPIFGNEANRMIALIKSRIRTAGGIVIESVTE